MFYLKKQYVDRSDLRCAFLVSQADFSSCKLQPLVSVMENQVSYSPTKSRSKVIHITDPKPVFSGPLKAL